MKGRLGWERAAARLDEALDRDTRGSFRTRSLHRQVFWGILGTLGEPDTMTQRLLDQAPGCVRARRGIGTPPA
jgi:hypothetical protein